MSILNLSFSSGANVYRSKALLGPSPGGAYQSVWPVGHGGPERPLLRFFPREIILDILAHYTPRYEAKPNGEIYLDLSGTQRLWGPPRDTAERIRSEVLQRLALTPRLGIAQNKLVSHIAAQVAGLGGLCQVFAGSEADFLSPLEVHRLPGVGRSISTKLFQHLGIRKIGELRPIPTELLGQLFGKLGTRLKRMAQGEDLRPVYQSRQEPELKRSWQLKPPSNQARQLQNQIWEQLEVLCFELRQRKQASARLHLRGIYSDGRPLEYRIEIIPPSQSEFKIFAQVLKCWDYFVTRRVRVRSLQMVLTKLGPYFEQLGFGEDSKFFCLMNTLDQIRHRYGNQAISFVR